MTESIIAEFIVGKDLEGAHAYIVHTRAPRFIARIIAGDKFASGGEGDKEGETYGFGDPGKEMKIHIVRWDDPVPRDRAETEVLLRRAAAAVKTSNVHVARTGGEAPHCMTVEAFRAAGEALFGQQWQTAMARWLEVSNRAVRYWASGKRPVPLEISDRIARRLLPKHR